mmetsp:Transcript_52507/g.58673  ORF Transcript_52507/g.58673 Transcript_52507/m.58673 type:complete len:640 (-) Transcript_52507:244-2163(-)
MSEAVPQPEALAAAAAAAAAVNLSEKYGMGDHPYHTESMVGGEQQQQQQQQEGQHNHNSVDDIIKGEQEQEHNHEQQEHAEQHGQGQGHDINEVSVTTEAAVEATAQVILTSNSAIAAANAATVPTMKREHATPTATSHTGRVSLLNDEDQQGKRRFFPRVKHLISNKEWEDFLSQILDYIEQAGAPNCPAASHKTDNSWYKAFDLVYNSVASDYSIPTGKNRYHKFKDKIVEVWVALEQQEGGHPGEHLCRSQAIQQLARHRKACAEAVTQRHQNSASNKRVKLEDGTTPRKSSKLNANGTPSSSSHTALGNAAALAKLISSGSKRSFSTSFGGNHGGGGGKASGIGDALGTSENGHGHGHGKKDPYWPNLAESSCLESLPQPLRQLVHLKQLSREMSAKTSNRVTKKSIDQHGKTVVDTAYLLALQEYIKALAETDTEEDTTTTTITPGNEGGGGGGGGENQDVVMDGSSGDGTAAAAVVPTPSTNKAYLRATSMAFLYRYASTVEEQRVLNDEYRKYSKKYISQVSVPVSSKNDDTNTGGTAGNGTSNGANGANGDGVVVVMEDGSFSTTTKKAAVNVDDVAASIKAEAAAATAVAVAETETIPTNMNANGNAIPTSSTVTAAAEVEASPLTAFSV